MSAGGERRRSSKWRAPYYGGVLASESVFMAPAGDVRPVSRVEAMQLQRQLCMEARGSQPAPGGWREGLVATGAAGGGSDADAAGPSRRPARDADAPKFADLLGNNEVTFKDTLAKAREIAGAVGRVRTLQGPNWTPLVTPPKNPRSPPPT
jgi:hypothetical protein